MVGDSLHSKTADYPGQVIRTDWLSPHQATPSSSTHGPLTERYHLRCRGQSYPPIGYATSNTDGPGYTLSIRYA